MNEKLTIRISVILILLFLSVQWNLAENLVYPPDANIVDVTKAPYLADNTGKTDVTEILVRACNFARDENRIVYFPNGTYLVSGTVCYNKITNWSHVDAKDMYRMNNCEDNAFVRYHGQSRDGVVIKLKDNAKGFEKGAEKAVLSTIRQNWSNIGFNNDVCNLTVDVGKGNPGAIGLKFNGSNTASLRNVRIITQDGQGFAGLYLQANGPSLIQHVEVEGFDIGIHRNGGIPNYVLEHIKLTDQNEIGLLNMGTSLTIRDLQSNNKVPAIRNQDNGHLIVIDSHFKGHDAASRLPAIDNVKLNDQSDAFLFVRNVTTQGYQMALNERGEVYNKKSIKEYSSHGNYQLFVDENTRASLNLPVKETPDIPMEPVKEWRCVDEFGAVGGDTLDDTEAFQKALDSGAKVVYAKTGQKYILGKTLHVGPDVRRVNLLWAQLVITGELDAAEIPLFKLTGENEHPFVIQKVHIWHFEANQGKFTFLHHACKRTVVMRDCHVHRGVAYWNSVPGGEVFIENTLGKVRGTPGDPYSFNFNGVKVWARQLNPDGGHHVLNDGGFLWVLGFKTEDDATRFTTLNNGLTEILGGIVLANRTLFRQHVLVNDNSHVSAMFQEQRRYNDSDPITKIIAVETRGDETRYLYKKDIPANPGLQQDRYCVGYVVPLYTGYNRAKVDDLLKNKFRLE